MKIALRLLIPLFIIASGWFTMDLLASKKKDPVRHDRRGNGNLPKIKVMELRRTDFEVIITSNGIVRAHNSTSLTPRVSGRIHQIDERFEDGAFFKANDVLVELDPTDFNAAVATAQARVARAEAALAQEEARAEQALLDWRDLGYTDEPSDLVRRKPQLKEATANLTAAHADLSAAERDVVRSKILAPYDGCVLRRVAGLGQSVSPGSSLGEIFSTEFAEIRLPLSATALKYFQLPEEAPGTKIRATLFDSLIVGSDHSWNGIVVRTEGTLNATSRELFVITRVADPYGLNTGHPPLRIGQPVRAEIDGRLLKDVFVLPREGLRGPKEIVLVNPEDSTIQRTGIEPIWEDKKHVIVRDDLPEGWLLVVSQLSYAANGAKVEIIDEDAEADRLKAAQSPPGESGQGQPTRPRGRKRGGPRG
ncbi:MAG: efflux RND transporter periplasmic adaptor subunit [Roseibacillus sp.]